MHCNARDASHTPSHTLRHCTCSGRSYVRANAPEARSVYIAHTLEVSAVNSPNRRSQCALRKACVQPRMTRFRRLLSNRIVRLTQRD